jgi:hypothetical protein
MIRSILALLLLAAAALLSPGHSTNYEQVICDNEPDPKGCGEIHNWYLKVSTPTPQDISCCGVGDAYWVDQIDKAIPLGAFVTITDNRDIKGRGPS